MNSKLYKFASSLGESLWPIIISSLSDKAVKLILEKLLYKVVASSAMGAWFATLLANKFAKEFVVPSIKILAIEGMYVIHLGEGKYLVKKLEEADNVEEYNDAVDDILS